MSDFDRFDRLLQPPLVVRTHGRAEQAEVSGRSEPVAGPSLRPAPSALAPHSLAPLVPARERADDGPLAWHERPPLVQEPRSWPSSTPEPRRAVVEAAPPMARAPSVSMLDSEAVQRELQLLRARLDQPSQRASFEPRPSASAGPDGSSGASERPSEHPRLSTDVPAPSFTATPKLVTRELDVVERERVVSVERPAPRRLDVEDSAPRPVGLRPASPPEPSFAREPAPVHSEPRPQVSEDQRRAASMPAVERERPRGESSPMRQDVPQVDASPRPSGHKEASSRRDAVAPAAAPKLEPTRPRPAPQPTLAAAEPLPAKSSMPQRSASAPVAEQAPANEIAARPHVRARTADARPAVAPPRVEPPRVEPPRVESASLRRPARPKLERVVEPVLDSPAPTPPRPSMQPPAAPKRREPEALLAPPLRGAPAPARPVAPARPEPDARAQRSQRAPARTAAQPAPAPQPSMMPRPAAAPRSPELGRRSAQPRVRVSIGRVEIRTRASEPRVRERIPALQHSMALDGVL